MVSGRSSKYYQAIDVTKRGPLADNYRILTGMARELLATAAQRELTVIDEKLFLELYAATPSKLRKAGQPQGGHHG